MNRITAATRLFFLFAILLVGIQASSQTINNWGVVGSATPNGWGGPDIPLSYNAGLNTWSAVVTLINGEIKFRNNNDWAVNYGDNGADGTLDAGGSNIVVAAGTYLITLDFTTLNYSISQTKPYYVNDNFPAGDLFTSATGNNTNAGTKAAPFATITYALSQAAAGDTIYVDAGTYTEQVTIYKGVVIKGAGQNLTSILKPAVTVAPPGSFAEQGVIQTAQSIIGDVHISGLSVTGDYTLNVTPVIIQSGGSVRNCTLQSGNQGIFVRIDPAIIPVAKTFVVDGNTINAEYIAVNFAGSSRLTATLSNNTLATFNPGFSTGVFAGTDFGTLTRLTVTGNIFSSYVTDGLFVNTNNGIISQNSFLGTGAKAINKFGGSTINATCNWYGSALATNVVSKITAGVTYAPWLIDGIDNSTATGFQTSATCPVSSSYYVNDNSQSGDVFTTAIGNNVNPGTSAAPYATLDYAIAQVPAGATIFVDAGTYNQAAQLTINKSITILGSNYLLSPNDATVKTNYNISRNAETIITGAALIVGADYINFKGLRFSPTSSAISQNGNFSHVKIEKTYFDVVGTGNIVNLQGSSGNPIVAFDFSITDSRFQRSDILVGNSINLGLVKSVWIDNNVFIESPATGNPFRGIALRTVGGQSVENTVFSNNYVKKLNVGVVPQMIQDWTINNNVFDSCVTGYSHSPFNIVSNNIFIRSNTFTNLRVGRSILVRGGSNGGVNNFNILYNTINQDVDGINGIVGMIQLDFPVTNNNGTVSVTGNKLNLGGDYNNTGIPANCGIILIGKHKNTTISFNELNFTATNARVNGPGVLPPVPTGIFISTDGGTGSGPIPADAFINILNNKITGFKSSIGIFDPTSTGLTPAVGYGYLTNGATVNINYNSFSGDSVSINNGTLSENINATCNFYNTIIPEIIITKISPETGDYLPWLVNGTDNEPSTTGFQPVPGSCTGRVTKWYVNDANTSGDVFTTKAGDDVSGYGIANYPFATITKALTEVQAGDTIFVDAGTYAEPNLTIGKSVTILGSNYLLSPNDATNALNANGARTTEAIISNTTWTIGASDIKVKGLTFDPQSKNALAQSNNTLDFDNIEISNNIFLATSTTTPVNLLGKQQQPLVTFNYSITNNRFIKSVAGNGANITMAGVDGILISGNTFTTNNSAADWTQNAYFSSGGFRNNNFVISNNTAYRSRFAFQSLNAIKAQVINNKVFETVRFLLDFNGLNVPTEINITDNEITIANSNGAPALSYAKSNGTDLSAPNIARIERNTITTDGTGWSLVPQALIAPTIDNLSTNTQVFIRDNKLKIIGDFNTQSDPGNYVSAIRFLNNSRQAVVERNEMQFTATNYNGANKFGIGLLTSGLQPGTSFNFLNNKFTGLPTSVAVQNSPNTNGFGGLPDGIVLNINYNSFTGDVMSINNGTSGQSANAGCNWYGSTAAQDFINKLTLPTVDPVPWLTNGTDNDVATGFQPVPNSCDGYPTLITLNSSTNVTCNGAANGSIDITTSYGKAPFTYTWTKDGDANFVSNSEDLSGLAPGTYRLAIVDGNGSNIYITDPQADGPGTIVVTITEPAVLTASADGTNNLCNGQLNGTASVTVRGGTTPYTYLWSNGATTPNISNLAAGVYSVTVTDSSGCTKTASYEVTQPALLTANAGGTNVSCFNGSNGTASVTADGGTAPYTYLWSNGATSSSITGLPAGVYSVTVTDANNCTKTASYEVTQPALLTANANGTNVSCFNGSNGTASVTAGGGTAPYTYLWSNGATSSSITGLPAGVYSVTVTDANSCIKTASYEVTQPALLTANASGTNVSCFNGSNGTASVTAGGGTAPYTYLWSNGATSSSLTGLPAGVYTVTVTDANSCTKTASYEVTQPMLLTASITNSSTACSNIATVNAGGGMPGYTYLWSNGSTAQTISGVPVGTYSVTVTDTKGCTVTVSITLTVPEAFNPSASVTNVTCFGANNGVITVINANGTAPFMFSKDGGVTFVSGTIPFSFTGLAPGTYNIAVKDVSGCTGFVPKTVTQPSQLVAVISNIQSTCYGLSTGAVNVTVSGGTTAYTYSWTGPNGFTSTQLNISNLAAGNYSLTVKDKNNCTVIVPVTVPSYNEIIVNAQITNVLCRNTATGAINLTVTGGSGSGFTYSWTGAVTSANEDLSNLAASTNYNVRITDVASGCFVNRTYAVTQPAANLSVTATSTNATGCNSLGTITATGAGGTPPYTYNINGGAYQSSALFTGLYAGTYIVGVRDANGCTASASKTITDNGSDEYESNNGRTQSKPISIGTTINARLAIAGDAADWFVITTPTGGTSSTYSLVITHPTPGISYIFDLYPASPNNAVALIPAGVMGTTRKDYLLAPGTSYRIGVTTTTLSFVCYSLSVNPLVPVTSNNNNTGYQVDMTGISTTDILSSTVYPNPHRGSFTLRIESPEEGIGTVEMYNANGQLLGERKVNLVKGKGNVVQYNNMNQAVLFYRVHIGKHIVNGKIIGAN